MSLRFTGLQAAAKARQLAKISRDSSLLIVLCADRRSADTLIEDLRFFLPEETTLGIPAWDPLPFEPVSPQIYTSAQRLLGLNALIERQKRIIVLPAAAALGRFLSPDYLEQVKFNLRVGQTIVREQLIAQCHQCGFRRTTLIDGMGEFAIRGSVVDLFPSTTSRPVRVEFFDDQIDSIKKFEIENQRSIETVSEISVLPVREHIYLKDHLSDQPELNQFLEKIRERGRELEVPLRELSDTLEKLEEGKIFPGIEMIQSIGTNWKSSLFDYLVESDTSIFINDEISFWNEFDHYWDIIKEREARQRSQHFLFSDSSQVYLSSEEFKKDLSRFEVNYIDHLEVLSSSNPQESERITVKTRDNSELTTRIKTASSAGYSFEPLKQALDNWGSKEMHVAFVVGSMPRAQRLKRILLDLQIHADIAETLNGSAWIQRSKSLPVAILIGQLQHGVQLLDESVVFIAESEVFGERSYRRGTVQTQSLKRLLGTLSQLKENDFVVHIDYGVGRYRGLVHREVEGTINDLVCIEYADSTLYLPVHNIGKIQRFVGAEGQKPVIDKLSSTRWSKTKEKVKKSVVALAGDLIKLYATRSVARGWRYEPEGAEDERFADTFPYDETADQLAAIEATLADMSSSKPMDRLICGDVGFGKTEVALRAAFKATQHARQIALLAPTTILVEQHKKTFTQRFEDLPVKVGAVSRFYSRKENKETLEQLAQGKLDIIIGTHRLLQKDIRFADLGLLIIDEEHRFGVKHKERLKQLRKNIDVLTLTATPIPRTLHMSLLSLRDISIISTPPQDRRTIRTYTAIPNPGLIRDSILRELQRHGQCYYVYNRVQGIEHITEQLRELVPEATFEFGHGQMPESRLEEIMFQFLSGKIDVLVCTTIIESGIDIPTANTMLIERADRFGLAQLYQLRGRVGRSSEQAYCYFLVPDEKKLSRDALERLRALQSLDDLGQGFHLAIRDLEIRGAGNLLGKEQSGSVLAVGFELYTKILKEAINYVKHDEPDLDDLIDPEINIHISAYIPEEYIPDVSERLVLYQRLSTLRSPEDAQDLRDEIIDRFAPPPQETENLIRIMSFRSVLKKAGVTKADFKHSLAIISFSPIAPIHPEQIIKVVHDDPEQFRFSKSHTLRIRNSEKLGKFSSSLDYVEGLLADFMTG